MTDLTPARVAEMAAACERLIAQGYSEEEALRQSYMDEYPRQMAALIAKQEKQIERLRASEELLVRALAVIKAKVDQALYMGGRDSFLASIAGIARTALEAKP